MNIIYTSKIHLTTRGKEKGRVNVCRGYGQKDTVSMRRKEEKKLNMGKFQSNNKHNFVHYQSTKKNHHFYYYTRVFSRFFLLIKKILSNILAVV